jgi:hypothetical protein
MRSSSTSGKKGQFFIIGALLFILLFYIGVSAKFSENIVIRSSDLNYLYKNIDREYRHVYNIGLNQSSEQETLVNFTQFVRNVTKERNVNFQTLVVFTKNSSVDLNVTILNYFSTDLNISIDVSGETQTQIVGSDSAANMIFSPADSELDVSIAFNSTEKELLLEKYKANIYFLLELSRGDDVIRGDFSA